MLPVTPTIPDAAQREAVALVERLRPWSEYSFHEMHQETARDLFRQAADMIERLALLSASAPVAPAVTADDVKAYARAWLDREGGWGEWEKALDALIEERAPVAPAGASTLSTTNCVRCGSLRRKDDPSLCLSGHKMPVAPAGGYAGLPMSDADLTRHFEASKRDRVDLVGSELRQIIGELRHYRALTPSAPSAAAPSEVGDGEWITVQAERALIVDRGKETILLDRLPSPVTLVIKVTRDEGKSSSAGIKSVADVARSSAPSFPSSAEAAERSEAGQDEASKAIDLRTPPTAAPAGDAVEAAAKAIRDAGHVFANDRNYERIARVAVRAAFDAAPAGDDAGLREIAVGAVTILKAIEEHCQNKSGLKGLDHADEGRRIRNGMKAFITTADAALSASPAPQGDE